MVDDICLPSRPRKIRNGLALEVGLALGRRHCGHPRRALFYLGETKGQLGRLMPAKLWLPPFVRPVFVHAIDPSGGRARIVFHYPTKRFNVQRPSHGERRGTARAQIANAVDSIATSLDADQI